MTPVVAGEGAGAEAGPDSAAEDMKYINEMLASFSLDEFPFAALFPARTTDLGALQLQGRTCAILMQLLHARQRDEHFRRDAEDRQMRLLEEIRVLEGAQRRQEERVRLQERELAAHRQAQQLQAEKQRQLEAIAGGVRDELARLKQVCLQKERQFSHELRKRERDLERLKDQLAAVLKDMPLREQRSELHVLQRPVVDVGDADADVDADADADADAPATVDRTGALVAENLRLRQLAAFGYGSLVQLVLDIFPELQLDASVLALVEAAPAAWVDEALGAKQEELVAILKENLAALAHEQHAQQGAAVQELRAQCDRAAATIAGQAAAIGALEQQRAQGEEWRGRVDALEAEKARLEAQLEARLEMRAGGGNQENLPATPKWLKQ